MGYLIEEDYTPTFLYADVDGSHIHNWTSEC
jgi:hypothetical protein